MGLWLKPWWLRAILEGRKTVEMRAKKVNVPVPHNVFLVLSGFSHNKCVYVFGIATVTNMLLLREEVGGGQAAWNRWFRVASCVDACDVPYKDRAVAYVLTNVHKFMHPVRAAHSPEYANYLPYGGLYFDGL